MFLCCIRSCLVVKGNSAEVAMHSLPPVSQRRISITFRRHVPPQAFEALCCSVYPAPAPGACCLRHPVSRIKPVVRQHL